MSADAATLRCPGCGATTEPGAQRCKYCEARLATVSCPSCMALIFDSARFCPSCGGRRARAEYPADAKCPACRGAMNEVSVGDTTFLECQKCDGLWVAAEAFERICSHRETQAAVIHQDARAARTAERQVRYRPCLTCGTMMNRVNFARLSGTVVDVCKQHGTFLDRGELQAVVAFIQGGGLERARQRQLDDLKEQEQRLRDQEARRRSPRGGRPANADFDRTRMERAAVTFGAVDFAMIVDLFSND